MAIRKVLLPLTGTAAGEAALATSLMIARAWNAHVLALHVRVDSRDVAPLAGEGLSGAMIEEMMSATEKESSDRAHAVRGMFDRFVTRHDVTIGDARPGAGHATASFAAVTGREEDLVAQQARLADLTVVPHPDAGEDVSSSDALHAGAVRFRPAGADLAAGGAHHDRHPRLPGLERHGGIGGLGAGSDALDAAGRGGAHPVGRRLPAARTGGAGTRGLPGAARHPRRHRDVPLDRQLGGSRIAGGGQAVRLRPAVDGRLFAFAAAPAHPGRRHPPRAGELEPAGDDDALAQALLPAGADGRRAGGRGAAGLCEAAAGRQGGAGAGRATAGGGRADADPARRAGGDPAQGSADPARAGPRRC